MEKTTHLLSTTFATCFQKPKKHGDCSGRFWGLQELLVPAAADGYVV